jgi:hypothetical protein
MLLKCVNCRVIWGLSTFFDNFYLQLQTNICVTTVIFILRKLHPCVVNHIDKQHGNIKSEPTESWCSFYCDVSNNRVTCKGFEIRLSWSNKGTILSLVYRDWRKPQKLQWRQLPPLPRVKLGSSQIWAYSMATTTMCSVKPGTSQVPLFIDNLFHFSVFASPFSYSVSLSNSLLFL